MQLLENPKDDENVTDNKTTNNEIGENFLFNGVLEDSASDSADSESDCLTRTSGITSDSDSLYNADTIRHQGDRGFKQFVYNSKFMGLFVSSIQIPL